MQSIQEVNLSLADATADFRDAILNRAIGHDTAASDGPLYGSKANVLTEEVANPIDLTAGGVTPAEYDGHAQQAMTWHAAYRSENNESYVVAARLTFIPTGDDTIGSQIVKAVAVYANNGTTLYFAKNLETPVVVTPEVPLILDITVSGLPVETQD